MNSDSTEISSLTDLCLRVVCSLLGESSTSTLPHVLKVILTGKFQKIADGLKMEDISAKTNSRMNSMFAYHYENLRPEVILKTDDDSFRLHYQDMEVRYSFKNLFAVWDGLEFMNTRIPIILHFQAKD
jgi:hypothetical protein